MRDTHLVFRLMLVVMAYFATHKICAVKKHIPNRDSVPVHLPENFDADTLLVESSWRKDRKDNLKAAMYYILDIIYSLSKSRKYRETFDEEGGYPLLAVQLKTVLGNRYLEALTLLEMHGVVERTDGYTKGHQSKLIRLTSQYSASAVKVRELPPGTRIRKNVRFIRSKRSEEILDSLANIPYVTKWFDPSRLGMDIKKAHAFIEFYRRQMRKKIPQTLPGKFTVEEIHSRINDRVNNMILTMNDFYAGNMRLSKTGKDHRLHSILSATKKELRTLYAFDGKGLVSIDLKSSQPYLFNNLTTQDFYQTGGSQKAQTLLPDLSTYLTGKTIQKELANILTMFPGYHVSQSGVESQDTCFSKISWKSDFYTLLISKASSEGQGKIFPDRTTVKRKMMQILYNDGVYLDEDPCFLLFRKWFPAEAKLIIFYKKLSRKKKSSLEKRKGESLEVVTNYLPILLQRLESFLILDKVCKTISEEEPEAPILTVHDCIMTTPEFANVVKDIMERELTRLTGLIPGLSVEAFDQDDTLRKLTDLATNDMAEILEKKQKGRVTGTKLRSPLMYQIPQNEGSQIFSVRYLDPSMDDDDYTFEKDPDWIG